MKNDDKASISLKKIICISILFVFIMTAAVVAGNVKLNNVKRIFSLVFYYITDKIIL